MRQVELQTFNMRKYDKFSLLLIFVTLVLQMSSQNLFLKTFSSTPNYTAFQMPYSSVDTLSQSSFITGGFKMRFSNGQADSLGMDSYLQKTLVNGLTKWHRHYHLNGFDLTFRDIKVLPNKDVLIGGQHD